MLQVLSSLFESNPQLRQKYRDCEDPLRKIRSRGQLPAHLGRIASKLDFFWLSSLMSHCMSPYLEIYSPANLSDNQTYGSNLSSRQYRN